MAQLLKGKMKYKVPDNAKPGDEIDVEGTFEADQSDYEGSLRGRLDQQKRQYETATEAVKKELDELKTKGGQAAPDPKDKERMEKLERDLAEERLARKVDDRLKKAGLADIPRVYRDSVKLDPMATDAEIEDAVKALKEDPDLTKLLKKDDSTTQTIEPTKKTPQAGGRGGKGSEDKATRLATLTEKARVNAPNLHAMLGDSDPEQQEEVLATWEAQGFLEKKA